MKIIRLSNVSSLSKAGIDFSNIETDFVHFTEKPVGKIPEYLDLKIEDFSLQHSLKRADRMVKMASYLAHRMMENRIIDKPILVNIGSSRGATESWERFYSDFQKTGKTTTACSPLTTQANISSEISRILQLAYAVHIDHSLTCSSGSAALLNAIAWLRSKMSNIALVGGSEASNTEFTLAQIEALGIGSNFNRFPCRPFNTESKNSFVLAEGVGLALLEACNEEELSSGNIIIENIGFAQTAPPSLTGISPEGTPLQKAMNMAIVNSKSIPDIVLAHAPGTIKGDLAEHNAINAVFSETTPAIYSSKWITGHTYAASAMLNISLAIKIFNGYIPQNYPYESYVPYKHPQKISKIMINSTGFGGNAVSILLRKI